MIFILRQWWFDWLLAIVFGAGIGLASKADAERIRPHPMGATTWVEVAGDG